MGQATIPVDGETKKAFKQYCKDEFISQGDVIAKLMIEKGYLDQDRKTTDKVKG